MLALLEPDLRQQVVDTLVGDTADAQGSQTLPPLIEGESSALAPSLFAAEPPIPGDVPDCYDSGAGVLRCEVTYPGFRIGYYTNQVGVADDFGGVPPLVQAVADALAYSKNIYEGMGFSTPNKTVTVELSDGMYVDRGVGYSISMGGYRYIEMNLSGMVEYPEQVYYLVSHEYFHQVQYTYFNSADYMGSEPYWWMEATAEWAAHRVQEQVDFPGSVGNLYASSIYPFLESDARLTTDNSALLQSGGQEYGTFLLAEYLQDRFGGDEAIRWTWDRIGDGTRGIAPVDAIEDYVQSRGSTYAESIEEFRLWNYVLSDDSGNVGYSDPDANSGGLWRDALGVFGGVEGEESYRRVTSTATIDSQTGVAEGDAQATSSNTAYIEIAKPAGVAGVARVTVTSQVYVPEIPSLTNTRASVIPMAEYPDQCADTKVLLYTLSDSELADAPADWLQGEVQIPAACSTITLAITNTSKSGHSSAGYQWSVVFEPTSATLSNGTIDLGVRAGGSLITDDVGLRLTGDLDSDVLISDCDCAAWGISDGTTSGWVSSDRRGEPFGSLELAGFTVGERSAVIDTTLGRSLVVQLEYHPSSSEYLYAVDVRVERTASTATSGAVLFDYALDFDVPPQIFHETVTWNSATGQLPEFVDLVGRDGFHAGNPLTQPGAIGGPVVLSEPYGPADQGTMIRLDLGELEVGDTVTFTIYVGVAPGPYTAAAAIDEVDPVIYAYAESGGVVGMFAVSDLTYHPSPAA